MINQIDPLNQFTWWSSLKHGGLLIAPARLAHYFSTDKPRLSSYWAGRLRSAVQAQQCNDARFSPSSNARFLRLSQGSTAEIARLCRCAA